MDLEGRIRVWRKFYVGAAVGYYVANTGKGERSGFPSTDEIFHPSQTPGLSQQSRFFAGRRLSRVRLERQSAWAAEQQSLLHGHLRYSDQQLDLHSFHRLEVGAEQYIPYWNRTRVIALQARAVGAWARDGQTVPFYLQPTLGGNDLLRGFERYRFYDQSAFHAAVEHRWYVFSNMHAALFFEAGKVAPKVSQLNFHKLEYAGGIGFRFTIQDTVIMRIDNAVSREDTGSCGRSAICGEETMNRAAILTFTAGLMLPGFPTRRSSFPTTHSKRNSLRFTFQMRTSA